MTFPRKKLIEVALPLEAINKESAREKSIRHGHPSTLHLWWARRPLAACRAVLFAQLVDDPPSHPEQFPTEEAQERERQRLFRIIEELVKWENSNNERVLEAARAEIRRSCNGNPPPVLDPFCGGGSIPLEAQRLGLEAHASDLNPVAVLITKALIEIPPKFAGRSPVHPVGATGRSPLLLEREWRGAQGLAEDVRYYGQWMRDEAEKRIGHLYPKVKLPKEYGGGEATVIAWLWARTVKCPNPACGAQMLLVRSFWLSTKKGKKAWIEPVVDKQAKTVRFEVKMGEGMPQDPPKIGRGAKFKCIVCGQIADDQHIKNEGAAKHMGAQLMAIVAEGKNGRIYLQPTEEYIAVAEKANPQWKPEQLLADDPRNLWCIPYGLKTFADLFTPRQLVALTTFSDLIGEVRERVLTDARKVGMSNGGKGLNDGGTGVTAYADAVATYLGMGVSKLTSFHCTLGVWRASDNKTGRAFGRQAIPMVWDFPEANPFAEAGGELLGTFEATCDLLGRLTANLATSVSQCNAITSPMVQNSCICTDPPYYDNVGYADLSDFFYVWLRRSLCKVYPDLFSTLLVPKAQELVATPYRFGGDGEKAKAFFEEGLGKAFARMREVQHPDYPLTVYYAFKQSETDDDDDGSAGVPPVYEEERQGGQRWPRSQAEGIDGVGNDVRGSSQGRIHHHRRLADTHGASKGSQGYC
jgi:putative DNA methylase